MSRVGVYFISQQEWARFRRLPPLLKLETMAGAWAIRNFLGEEGYVLRMKY